MQLSQSQANAVKRGDKTELRRPWTGRSPYRSLERGVQFSRPRGDNDPPPKHGDDTTVWDEACRVVIWKQESGTLGDVEEADARAEGFKASGKLTALAQFREWWDETYEAAWRDSRRVWVVRFEVVNEDTSEFLADTRSGHGDYTTSRSRAVDDLQIVSRVTVEHVNKRRREDAAPWEREKQQIAASIGRLTADPETRLAAAREIRGLQRQLDAIDRKLKSAA